jgi:hypothetical protein
MIAFSLACYASVTGRFEEAKVRLPDAIDLIRAFDNWRSTTKTFDLCGIGLGI